MRIRTFSAVATAGLMALTASAGVAAAETTPPASGPPMPALTFVPPRVGALSVDIGPTIINGKVTDPGLHVLLHGTTLPPMSGTLPPMDWTPGRGR
jgi:hypothetical protein